MIISPQELYAPKGGYVAVTGSRDLTDADSGKYLVCNGAYTLTAPNTLTETFGCLIKSTSGQVTVAASGGATLVNKDSHTKSGGTNHPISVIRSSATTFDLLGSTGA